MKEKSERLIFEIQGEKGTNYFDSEDIPEVELPENFLRKEEAKLPVVSERSAVKHYVHLAEMNLGVDHTFYPLGSCTMKYNPRNILSTGASDRAALLHPFQPEGDVQGALEVMKTLEDYLCEITGLNAVTLMPGAGAHGELTGLLILKKYLIDMGKEEKNKIIVPDTAHGTNPASSNMAGFSVVQVKSGEDGYVRLKDVEKEIDETTAGIMLTNPNTFGIFERDFKKIADAIHNAGGLVYMDGANLNALTGRIKPGQIGADILQVNLHKTFSTPHGGGGPGSGPVAVKDFLEKYLPGARIVYDAKEKKYNLEKREKSIGMIRGFLSHFAVCLSALAYILRLGKEGFERVSGISVLNARYLRKKLEKYFYIPYPEPNLHEFVITDKFQKQEKGITTLDIAKALLDRGFHPPTVYFPITVQGAMMIEPTETEPKETLDEFAETMIKIINLPPEDVKNSPQTTPRKRLDEVRAARKPVLRWLVNGVRL